MFSLTWSVLTISATTTRKEKVRTHARILTHFQLLKCVRACVRAGVRACVCVCLPACDEHIILAVNVVDSCKE